MGIFGRKDDDDTEGAAAPAPPDCASLSAFLAAPLTAVAATTLRVGFTGREPTTLDPHSTAAIVLDLAKLIAAQPGEPAKASALVPDLHLPVEEAVQVLERSLLVRSKQRGSTDLALYLTRRGARALADGDVEAWIDVPAEGPATAS